MANIRIKDLSTDSALSAGDYVVVDSASEGSRKFDLGTELDNLKEEIEQHSGVSDDLKAALLQLASKVAYIDDDGQTYYQDLYDALYPPAEVVSISAVYTQSGTVYDTDTLDSLKADLVVTATYDDNTTAVVTNYTLSGTLTAGTSTITVSYGGKTTTFTVTVTQEPPYTFYDYIQSDGKAYIDTGLEAKTYCMPTYAHEIKVAHYKSESTKCIYGSRKAWGDANARNVWQTALNFTANYCGSGTGYTLATDSLDIPAIIKTTTDKKIYYNGTLAKDNSSGSAPDLAAFTFNIALFAESLNQSGSGYVAIDGGYVGAFSQARIYYFKVWDANDNLVAEMKPALRKSDNAIGMYDTVRDMFFENARDQGAFTLGNE